MACTLRIRGWNVHQGIDQLNRVSFASPLDGSSRCCWHSRQRANCPTLGPGGGPAPLPSASAPTLRLALRRTFATWNPDLAVIPGCKPSTSICVGCQPSNDLVLKPPSLAWDPTGGWRTSPQVGNALSVENRWKPARGSAEYAPSSSNGRPVAWDTQKPVRLSVLKSKTPLDCQRVSMGCRGCRDRP